MGITFPDSLLRTTRFRDQACHRLGSGLDVLAYKDLEGDPNYLQAEAANVRFRAGQKTCICIYSPP